MGRMREFLSMSMGSRSFDEQLQHKSSRANIARIQIVIRHQKNSIRGENLN